MWRIGQRTGKHQERGILLLVFGRTAGATTQILRADDRLQRDHAVWNRSLDRKVALRAGGRCHGSHLHAECEGALVAEIPTARLARIAPDLASVSRLAAPRWRAKSRLECGHSRMWRNLTNGAKSRDSGRRSVDSQPRHTRAQGAGIDGEHGRRASRTTDAPARRVERAAD